MKIAGIIPARYGSTRFPGKPLADIDGQMLIERVYKQAAKCPDLDQVVVATDDDKIADAVRSFGGRVVMTSSTHLNGTSRCAEAAGQLSEPVDAVINIQGDEPFIQPQQIAAVARLLRQNPEAVATLVKPLYTYDDITNPNVVKAVVSKTGRALYFSRATIPYQRDKTEPQPTYYKHLGIYGYATTLLNRLVSLNPSSLEISEKLEQLRWLEHDINIYAEQTDHESIAIDSPDDIDAAVAYIRQSIQH